MSNLINLLLSNKLKNPVNLVQADQTKAAIYLEGPIFPYDYEDTYVNASKVAAALNALNGADVDIYLSSEGGSVTEARKIVALLDRYPGNVHIVIDALAASAASWVIQAADQVSMYQGARVMVHNARTIALGDSAEMRGVADMLESYDKELAQMYSDDASKRGKSKTPKYFAEAMTKETWYTADEALEAGLVDNVIKIGSSRGAPKNIKELYPNAPEFEEVVNNHHNNEAEALRASIGKLTNLSFI